MGLVTIRSTSKNPHLLTNLHNYLFGLDFAGRGKTDNKFFFHSIMAILLLLLRLMF